MEAYDLWALSKLILGWVGIVAGGIVCLGCVGATVNSWIEGKATPFGAGKSDWWLSFVFCLFAAGVSAACVYYVFFVKRDPIVRESAPPQWLREKRRRGQDGL